MKIGLFGTCNNSTWREELIPLLKQNKIDFFNPIVDDWNEHSQQREIEERENCNFCLYVITPEMTGVYSIAEVVDDSNKRPEKTIFMVYDKNNKFSKEAKKSLNAVKEMIKRNDSNVVNSFEEIIEIVSKNKTDRIIENIFIKDVLEILS